MGIKRLRVYGLGTYKPEALSSILVLSSELTAALKGYDLGCLHYIRAV